MFHQPRQDVLRLENAEDSSGRRASKMNPSRRYYIYILWSRSIPTRTREWCKGAAKRGLGPEEEAESGLALRGIPRVNAPWMNDEPWGRGGFLLSTPPSAQPNSNRIPESTRCPTPKSRLDSRVVVDQDTDPYYTFSPRLVAGATLLPLLATLGGWLWRWRDERESFIICLEIFKKSSWKMEWGVSELLHSYFSKLSGNEENLKSRGKSRENFWSRIWKIEEQRRTIFGTIKFMWMLSSRNLNRRENFRMFFGNMKFSRKNSSSI